MNDNNRPELTTNQKKAVLIGSTLVAVGVGVICKRKINALEVAAAANAVQSWVDQNARAGFSTYLLTAADVTKINSSLENMLPVAA